MHRNIESNFALNPTKLDMQRSSFDRPSTIKTSFNIGELIPFYIDPVLPGDSFSVDTSKVVRMQPLVTAPMDDLYLDTYYFFVPSRLCWTHWREFMGENTTSPWIPSVTYSEPQITSPAGGWQQGTIADYLGLPISVGNLSVSALPMRAYALICNEWFRDENLTDPLTIPNGDATSTGSNGSNYVTDVALGGKPFMAAKTHDYFTSCLPAPQKGGDVTIPLTGAFPVVTGADHAKAYDPNGLIYSYYNDASPYAKNNNYPINRSWPVMNSFASPVKSNVSYDNGYVQLDQTHHMVPTNLWADLGYGTSATSINSLRIAFQLQKLLERDALGGSRYTEILRSHFGVTSPDSRLQRPEYLGGNRVPIHISQITQQSGTVSGQTPQGTVTGMSLTSDNHSDFTKSFVEHGYVIGVMVARYAHTYQQGIERFWSRSDRYSYYWPVLANIGEQPVYNREIFAQGSTAINPVSGKPYDDEVFGYQEAWAEYRYKPSRVSGQMRSAAIGTLQSWHWADSYSALPVLSDSWIREDPSNVDRTLVVAHSVSDQLFADIYVKNRTVRPMPVYSVPGLIDHH